MESEIINVRNQKTNFTEHISSWAGNSRSIHQNIILIRNVRFIIVHKITHNYTILALISPYHILFKPVSHLRPEPKRNNDQSDKLFLIIFITRHGQFCWNWH